MSASPAVIIADLPVQSLVRVVPAQSGKVVQVVAPINDTTVAAAAEAAAQAALQYVADLLAGKANKADLGTSASKAFDVEGGVAGYDRVVQWLAGKATPADISAAISQLTAGTPAELDTFLEAYNRFLAEEGALSALTSLVSQKAAQADLASHTGNASNPHGVSKAQVGLGSVDNTADASKPVSTAQAASDAAVQAAAAIDATNKAGAAQAAAAGDATTKADAARSGAVSDVRGGVASSGDTLAKLLAIISAIQSGIGIFARTKAQLDANTTALTGIVDSDGVNNGTYGRATPSDPSTPWVKTSGATLTGLDDRTNFMGGDDGLSGYLYALRDLTPAAMGRLLYAIDGDGSLIAKLAISLGSANGLSFVRGVDGRYTLSFGDALGRIPIGAGFIDPSVSTTEGDLGAWVDAVGRMILLAQADGRVLGKFCDTDGTRLARLDEVANPAALSARVDRALSTFGTPRTEVYPPERLRVAHHRLAVLRDYGGVISGANAQLGLLFQGDSWSTTGPYWITPFAEHFAREYGDAGPGYCGFGFTSTNTVNGCARPNVLLYAKSGSWVATYGTAPMPDHSLVTSGASGDALTLTYTKPAGGPDIAAAKVFAIASNTATAQFRINGGAWVALDLTGAGFKLLDLGTIPTGSFTVEIQALSAGVQLGGADFRTTAKGVIVHKGGSSGTRSSQWASADAAIYQAALAALAPHTISLLSGTNSQSNYDAEAERGYVQTLITRWRAALPAADLMLITPPENARVGNAYPMSSYADVHRQLAFGSSLAHLDLQSAFGVAVADYADGSARPWLDNTLIHPSVGNGGYVIADRVARILEYA